MPKPNERDLLTGEKALIKNTLSQKAGNNNQIIQSICYWEYAHMKIK